MMMYFILLFSALSCLIGILLGDVQGFLLGTVLALCDIDEDIRGIRSDETDD